MSQTSGRRGPSTPLMTGDFSIDGRGASEAIGKPGIEGATGVIGADATAPLAVKV